MFHGIFFFFCVLFVAIFIQYLIWKQPFAQEIRVGWLEIFSFKHFISKVKSFHRNSQKSTIQTKIVFFITKKLLSKFSCIYLLFVQSKDTLFVL